VFALFSSPLGAKQTIANIFGYKKDRTNKFCCLGAMRHERQAANSVNFEWSEKFTLYVYMLE